MVLIFWQGIISIHQKTFLEALTQQPSVTKVLMVVEHAITPYRKNMGWEVPEIKGVEIIVGPSKEDVKRIFHQYKDAVHVTGGVRIGKMMTMAFNECARIKGKMGSLSEAFDRTGAKGKLRGMKYYYNKLRHYRHIDFFLAVGKEGVKTYTNLGFDPKRVFPWAYFVSLDVPAIKPKPETDLKRIIYAGRIEEGKGIYRFAEQLAAVQDKNYRLDIYGGGPDEEKLKQLVADKGLGEQMRFFPFLKYNDLVQQYVNYDWVVLPSTKKDGWGVIISEGFLNGLKAVCSNICGVSWAIKNGFNGVTFDWATEGSCRKAIDTMLEDKNFADSATIKEWAQGAVSGEAGARYYMKILESVYGGKEMPPVPWVQKR
jgi:glycosyltransferase involved in cell wall biosynthesis